MEDFHGFVRKHGRNSGGGGSSRMGSVITRDEEEYQVENVWWLVKDTENSSPQMKNSESYSSSSSSYSARRVPSTPRLIQGRGDVSLGVKQSSAPVNIPDLSTFYGKTHWSSRNGSWVGNGNDDDDDGHDDGDGDGDGDGDDTGNMVPPHEWIARKLERSQISSFSMCEGIGRTLKGRDLSKVRNAVLTKTGFLE